MRIAVFGTGGVGGYFGGRLAEAGEEVIFIARGEHLRAIQERGLQVESTHGDFIVYPAQAIDDPVEGGEVGLVLVGVKAWQVPEAARAMLPLIGTNTVVLPLQNGVEAANQLAEVLGREHVLGGLCRIMAFVDGPGRIRHVGIEPTIVFGELNNQSTTRLQALQEAFAGTHGVTAEIPPDIHAAIWQKFLLIVSWSGVGAITHAPIGVFRSLPETRQMLEQVMQEVESLARARGVNLAPDIVPKTLAFIDSLPAPGTASMQRDIMAGRPSELESQNGAVVRLGEEAGVPVPVNTFIYRALLPQELRARGQLDFPA